MYSFEQMLCTKTVGPGVRALVQRRLGDRNEVAAGLGCGDFVLFDARNDRVEPIWLGRVMSNPEWNGEGVYKNKDTRKITFDGVDIGRGEVAVYVMWYEKINATSDKLEYWVSRTEREPLVQNNRYLIPIEVNLNQMLGSSNKVPKLRTSTRREMARAESNSQNRIRDWHDKEIGIVWEMSSDLRRMALSLCNFE